MHSKENQSHEVHTHLSGPEALQQSHSRHVGKCFPSSHGCTGGAERNGNTLWKRCSQSPELSALTPPISCLSRQLVGDAESRAKTLRGRLHPAVPEARAPLGDQTVRIKTLLSFALLLKTGLHRVFLPLGTYTHANYWEIAICLQNDSRPVAQSQTGKI